MHIKNKKGKIIKILILMKISLDENNMSEFTYFKNMFFFIFQILHNEAKSLTKFFYLKNVKIKPLVNSSILRVKIYSRTKPFLTNEHIHV